MLSGAICHLLSATYHLLPVICNWLLTSKRASAATTSGATSAIIPHHQYHVHCQKRRERCDQSD